MQRPKNPPRGTYDLLPKDSEKWQMVEKLAKDIFQKASFQEIRTPIFEATEIFARAAGETSDIVNKEMYTFEDRSGRSITLRPEGTAGVVRAFLSNGLDRAPKPVKLWYQGPMFRYERSQTGRYRQFTQLGLEQFGSNSPEIEFEMISMAWNLFQKLEIENLTLEINSVGDKESREIYQKAMKEFLNDNLSQICPDCQKRAETNPLRALDCKVPEDQELYQSKAPKIQDYLNEDCKNHQDILLNLFKEFQMPYSLNQSLVRGLDYYTKTVFEIKTSDSKLGVQNTICAGGRYDGLVKELGGPETSAFGWALGMERLITLLNENSNESKLDYFVTYPVGKFNKAYKIVQDLRNQGYSVAVDYENSKDENKQFKIGQKLNAKEIITAN
ncbi:MAG: histidine--tRNA ligase [Candidatus Caenarcaniphilales bacterium]|nr:histidine--tRNA ligase [Candidatus Caenarcaniphilales bacterium]